MLLQDDMELLRAYATEGSEEAFETILNRHVNLVYSTALRQVGDPSLASEVTQTTFIILARKAGRLETGTILSGWLYRTAQFAATRAIRTETRRREREKEAVLMQTEPSESIWEQLAPVLDQGMAHLGTADRNALVLRYFENKTAKDVGRELGINEAAAQKRLARAVEKLRAFCTKKGIVLSATGLTALVSANAVKAAPASVSFATTTSLKAGAVAASSGPLTSGTLKLMAWAKFKFAMLTSLGVATAVMGTALCIQYFAGGAGPRYKLRGLSSWLTQLDSRQTAFSTELPWTRWENQQVKRFAAQENAAKAILAMGSNAVPQLIAVLGDTNLSFWERMSGHPEKLIQARQREAALALELLGPVAKPWLPQLSELSRSGRCPKESAVALAAIGPEGWEVLVKNIQPTNEDYVACAIWAVGSHRINIAGTREALRAVYDAGTPASMNIVSLWALSEISDDHRALIPLLIDCLHSRDRSDVRWGAAFVLGKLGPEARSAVPDLLEELKDRDRTVHREVESAIQQIDPQTAAQAGISDQLSAHVPKTFLLM